MSGLRPYLISHQSGNRPANFMILWTFSQRAEQDEKKPVQQKRTTVFGVKPSKSIKKKKRSEYHLINFVYNLVVMGTSARPLSSTAGDRRMKATTGRSRNSSSPTRTLDASAPGGIFFMKWRSICEAEGSKTKT